VTTIDVIPDFLYFFRRLKRSSDI